ncbi:hypothetical protein HYX12_00080 [Candidatus Woesearchaeota archaeon]|nr:hypothetical protein [Candidatus Woesearchaeota archaeon]
MSLFTNIISLIMIALVVGVIILSVFNLDFGFAGRVLSGYKGTTSKYLDETTTGTDSSENADIPTIHRQAIERLRSTITKMQTSSKQNCFANYGGTPETGTYSGFPNLGEKGTQIIMEYDFAEDQTKFKVYGGATGQQLVTDLLFSIKGMYPCVIAGSSTITFFQKFIEQKDISQDKNYYSQVSNLEISYEDKGVTCNGGNSIRVNGLEGVNSECNNLLDGGWLFTPDNKHICFIPTVDVNNNDPAGIDDDYISGTEETGIRERIAKGKLEGGLEVC